MPIDPREMDRYAVKEYYQHDAPCKRCGYNLKGLVKGGKCPECGFQRKIGGVLAARDNLLYAPPGYLRTLQIGAMLMGAGVVGAGLVAAMGVAQSPERAAAGVRLVASGLWLVGVWIMTSPRQVSERTPVNPREEWKVGRWVNRGVQSCWLLAALAVMADIRGPSPLVGGATAWSVAGGILEVIAMFGLVPLAFQIAELAEWGADSGLAARLRGAAWGLAVFGIIVYAGALAPTLLGPFGFFLLIPLLVCAGLWVISLLAFGVSVLQFALMTNWAIVNSEHLAARDARLRERHARDQRAAAAGVYRDVAGLTLERENAGGVCPQCGYSLEGLPPNAPCPECGNELSPMPARKAPPEARPAWMRDDAPIPLEPEAPPKRIK
ncbi:MAG: hypothetical protein ACF8R7_09225 [Phycisphaerales bacterium JB039]